MLLGQASALMRKTKSGAKNLPAARPWMIGH
jgi:hypothetical protein